jgi:cob(I)alamin adenosyltransferase
MNDRRLDFDSAVATGRGDDGTTGLLFGGERIRKDDLRTEAYGTVDEAVATLGLARAELTLKAEYGVLQPSLTHLGELILRLQRELFVVGAELATNPSARDKQRDGETRVTETMVSGLDEILRDMESRIELPREFTVPGETRTSATLEMARTITRRAERRAVTLAAHDAAIAEGQLIPYLNRLADLLWILARVAEGGESRGATMARTSRPKRSGTSPTSTATSEARES